MYEITLKPGQGVIVSLHECVFDYKIKKKEVIGPNFHFQECMQTDVHIPIYKALPESDVLTSEGLR